MNFNLSNELRVDNLILTKINTSDKDFIEGMFADRHIKKYYIVPKEARQDYKMIVGYWLNDIKNGAGFAWIITEKGSGFFSSDTKCGFVAFEFRDSIENARISYALLQNYRRKGIATKSVKLVIDFLTQNGVKSFEADIDRDNLQSEKVVERLGFSANKRQALVDPEMMREGEIRMRALWKKDLIRKNLNEPINLGMRIPINASIEELIFAINPIGAAIEQNGQHPVLLVKYLYLLGRIRFLEAHYEKAQDAFGQCNSIIRNENLPENHENFYWFARIKEERGESKEDIIMYYDFALEKYTDNPELITKEEIIQAKSKV